MIYYFNKRLFLRFIVDLRSRSHLICVSVACALPPQAKNSVLSFLTLLLWTQKCQQRRLAIFDFRLLLVFVLPRTSTSYLRSRIFIISGSDDDESYKEDNIGTTREIYKIPFCCLFTHRKQPRRLI